MTVYILKNNYMCIDDGVCIDTIVGVYKDLKKAQKQMEQEIKNAKIDFKNYDTEQDKYNKDMTSWSIWLKGEYFNYHCDISIDEQTIIE